METLNTHINSIIQYSILMLYLTDILFKSDVCLMPLTHSQETCTRRLQTFLESNFDTSSCKFMYQLVQIRAMFHVQVGNLHKKSMTDVQDSHTNFLSVCERYQGFTALISLVCQGLTIHIIDPTKWC